MKGASRGLPLWGAVLLILLLPQEALCAAHHWQWNVPVLPPAGGWEREPGKSIGAALSWHEAEIGESGSGVGGHDIQFIRLPEGAAQVPVDAHTVAVMSFAGPEEDARLVDRMRGSGLPVLLSGGEDLLFDTGGGPLPNIFALDLYRDYRCRAFALYAARTLKQDATIALAASRFTVNQEREAKICFTLLDEAGFMPIPLWVDASARDAFRFIAQEIEDSADGVLITFLGGMGAKEMWRNFMRARRDGPGKEGWRLWNCTAPDPGYLSFQGMVFADQNLFLPERGGFRELKRRMWGSRAIAVQDPVAAGRAEALVEWLKRGIAALPQPVDALDRPGLLLALARAKDIPFGSQRLEISPALHRPSVRQVFIAEVRSRAFWPVDSLPVPGLAYAPSY